MDNKSNLLKDANAGLVVFLVALPLCLGIALASGAPLFSGIIAGIVGGIIVGMFSGSRFGVSGPAAGLTVIVATSIQQLGSYEVFLTAVVLAGFFQVILGIIKSGYVAYFFPNSVIKGMLAAIGIIIILKQIPHAFGIDSDFIGDESFFQKDGENTISEIFNILRVFHSGALIIGLISILTLVFWESKYVKKIKFLSQIPGALIVVLIGVSLKLYFDSSSELLHLKSEHLVNLPVSSNFAQYISFLRFPDFTTILSNASIWKIALVIAVVASLETLLCVEATDKLDPNKTITPTNKELIAQGIGNIFSGLIGGIPVTQVIVRSSANIQANAKSKKSTIFHGILLVCSSLFIPNLLNNIPLASLSAILLLVGYKLAKPSLFKSTWKEGFSQFFPFIITVLAIVFTDLLLGIGIGLFVSLGFILYTNFKNSITSLKDKNHMLIRFNKDIFFFNKAQLMKIIEEFKNGDIITIDGTKANFIDQDIYLTLIELENNFVDDNIEIELKNITFNKTIQK